MAVRITTLSENSVAVPDVIAEWGFSVFVEIDGLTLLLDTGAGNSAVHNAGMLGIDLKKVERIILSHGHYDHTGGMGDILHRIGHRVKVIAHPDVFVDKVAQYSQNDPPRYIGMPFKRDELESMGADFQLTSEPVWLSENVVTSGEIPMITDFETIDPGLCVRVNGEVVPDPLRDDQAVFVKTEPGLLVVLGCAHRGIINTLHHARNITGVDKIHCVIGGTHLLRASELQMEMTVATLRDFGVQRLGVSHCTGMPAAMRLAQEFGPGFFFNNSGSAVAV